LLVNILHWEAWPYLADLELKLEQAKSPRNPEAVMMKELTRQCSKHIKWKKKEG